MYRKSYAASFEELGRAVDIVGEPMAHVERCPRPDDEEPGPSIYKEIVEGVCLGSLTLPGLYVGRAWLRGVSFAGSDLHLSTFSRSELVDCSFSGADLTGGDLRGCVFSRCSFRGARLARADLRGSRLRGCDFGDADLAGALMGLRGTKPDARREQNTAGLALLTHATDASMIDLCQC